ncbi:MAG: hypothetical protein ACLU6W_10090 [Lachnospiraceae bacterium]|nr:hypothetical protein [Candidatus Fimimorpha excrementavium]
MSGLIFPNFPLNGQVSLSEYRRRHAAALPWEEVKKQLINQEIRYCEVWIQEDEATNH